MTTGRYEKLDLLEWQLQQLCQVELSMIHTTVTPSPMWRARARTRDGKSRFFVECGTLKIACERLVKAAHDAGFKFLPLPPC